MKRVAGVEPLSPSLEDCAPPAHDRVAPRSGGGGLLRTADIRPDATRRHAAKDPGPAGRRVGATPSPTEAFGRHFLRCFFCRIGDRYTEDHFCEDGRDLIVAVLDEYADRVFA